MDLLHFKNLSFFPIYLEFRRFLIIQKWQKRKLPPSDYTYRYAKVYNEKKDIEVAYLMAKGLKNKLRCNIAIGTTAGIGRGGICILTDNRRYLFTTDIYGDILTGKNLVERSENGISKTLNKLVEILSNEYGIRLL
ncbi:TPA: hypothetical protein EYP45_04770 [Candidatus Peregrinibacteria bacterium]|nr:hypothetical protein [Candidatus Peregrinibacteria bacterium]